MHPPTSQQSPESKDAAILKIDAEIQSLTERILHLKSQRNVLSSGTYTLPAEILSKIFMIVQVDCKDGSLSSDFDTVLEEWLVIAQVSQHWRSVALGCASLWCEIDETVPPAFIQEFLARSRGHSLFVGLTDSFFDKRKYDDNALSLSSIFAETSRIQALRIETEERFSAIQPYTPSTPAAKLTKLRIRSIDLSGIVLFGGMTPCLTDLSISKGGIDITSPLFMHNLTTLDIDLCPAGSTIDWLRVLKPMSYLSCLTLNRAFTDEVQGAAGAHTRIPKGFEAVSLPQLSRLIIHGTWLESDLDFLSHITFPFQTRLEFSSCLSISAPNLDEVSHSPLAAFLRVHSNSRCDSSKLEIERVKLENSTGRVESLGGASFAKTSIVLVIHSESIPILDLQLRGLEGVHCREAHLAEILSLPISHATSFTTNLGDTKDIWEMFSCGFPHLQEIYVSDTLDKFLTVLNHGHENTSTPSPIPVEYSAAFSNTEDDVDVDMMEPFLPDPGVVSSEQPIPFGSLKSIYIKGRNLSYFEDALIKALRYRQGGGLPIKELRLSRCSGLTDSLKASLKDLVEDVHWHECTRLQRPRRRIQSTHMSDSD